MEPGEIELTVSDNKEQGRPHDMDNNRILSLIEQTMCVEDREIWTRDVKKEKSLGRAV